MSEYPSIRPEDVREGDVVRGNVTLRGRGWTTEGIAFDVHGSLYLGDRAVPAYADLRLVSRTDWRVGDRFTRPLWGGAVYEFTDIGPERWSAVVVNNNPLMAGGAGGPTIGKHPFASFVPVVHRPAPPEPALRVGDWVRCTHSSGMTGQVISIDAKGWHSVQGDETRWGASGPEILTRIEPPVGWPVGVPDSDGRTRWYCRVKGYDTYHRFGKSEWRTWPDLVAAGGVPALAPAATP